MLNLPDYSATFLSRLQNQYDANNNSGNNSPETVSGSEQNNATTQDYGDYGQNYSNMQEYQSTADVVFNNSSKVMSDATQELIDAQNEYTVTSKILNEMLGKNDYDIEIVNVLQNSLNQSLEHINATNNAIKEAQEAAEAAGNAKKQTYEAAEAIKQRLANAQDLYNNAGVSLDGAINEYSEALLALEMARKLKSELPLSNLNYTVNSNNKTVDQYDFEIIEAKVRDLQEAAEPKHMSIAEAEAAGYTVINNVDQLNLIRENLDGKYILGANINMNGINWEPIGDENNPFTGVLNGNGYTISNLSINTSEGKSALDLLDVRGVNARRKDKIEELIWDGHCNGENYGLFGVTTNAVIKNLNINNADIQCGLGAGGAGGTDNCVGIVAGQAHGTKFENLNVSGYVQGTNSVGGIAGSISDSDYAQFIDYKTGQVHVEVGRTELTDVNVDVDIKGVLWLGGIAGGISGTKNCPALVTNCQVNGSIESSEGLLGGALAAQGDEITICGFKGNMDAYYQGIEKLIEKYNKQNQSSSTTLQDAFNEIRNANKSSSGKVTLTTEAQQWLNGTINGVIGRIFYGADFTEQQGHVTAQNIEFEGTINGKEFSGYDDSHMDEFAPTIVGVLPSGASEFDYANIPGVSGFKIFVDRKGCYSELIRVDSIEALDEIAKAHIDKNWGGEKDKVIFCNFDFLSCMKNGNHKYSLSDYLMGIGDIIINDEEGCIPDWDSAVDVCIGEGYDPHSHCDYISDLSAYESVAQLAKIYPDAFGYCMRGAGKDEIEPFVTDKEGSTHFFNTVSICKKENPEDYKTRAEIAFDNLYGDEVDECIRAIQELKDQGMSDADIYDSLIAWGGNDFTWSMGLSVNDGRFGSTKLDKAFKDAYGVDDNTLKQYREYAENHVNELRKQWEAAQPSQQDAYDYNSYSQSWSNEQTQQPTQSTTNRAARNNRVLDNDGEDENYSSNVNSNKTTNNSNKTNTSNNNANTNQTNASSNATSNANSNKTNSSNNINNNTNTNQANASSNTASNANSNQTNTSNNANAGKTVSEGAANNYPSSNNTANTSSVTNNTNTNNAGSVNNVKTNTDTKISDNQKVTNPVIDETEADADDTTKYDAFKEYCRQMVEYYRDRAIKALMNLFKLNQTDEIKDLTKAEYEKLVEKANEKGIDSLTKDEKLAMVKYNTEESFDSLASEIITPEEVETYPMTQNIDGEDVQLFTTQKGDILVPKKEDGKIIDGEYTNPETGEDYDGFYPVSELVGTQAKDANGNLLFKDKDGNILVQLTGEKEENAEKGEEFTDKDEKEEKIEDSEAITDKKDENAEDNNAIEEEDKPIFAKVNENGELEKDEDGNIITVPYSEDITKLLTPYNQDVVADKLKSDLQELLLKIEKGNIL